MDRVPPPPQQPAHYDAIDVLRGLAAVVVVLSHWVPHLHRYSDDMPRFVTPEAGWNAVKLFFVISGFVIFYSLGRCRSLLDFAVMRFSRLYPAYWVSMIFVTAVAVVAFGEEFWLGGLVSNLTMAQTLLGFPDLDIVYWSLGVELVFYFHAAWVFVLGLHARPKLVAGAWLVLTCVWALTVYEFSPGNSARSGWGAKLLVLDYSPYFAMGIVFFDIVTNGWSRSSILLLVLALVAEFLLFSWEGLLVASCAALMMTLAVDGKLQLMVCRPTLWLGEVSYPLYLTHRKLGFMLSLWALGYVASGWLLLLLMAAGALALAQLLHQWVERPAINWIRGRYSRLRMLQSSVEAGRPGEST